MAVSPKHEAAVVREVQRDPSAHVLLADRAYKRKDGALPVYRDGLQEHLHRRLYRLLIDPTLGRERLARTCDKWGCVNPHHYRATGQRIKGGGDHCINGHQYTPDNTTPTGHCRICAENRQAARRSHGGRDGGEINAAKTHCPQGHSYLDRDNVYIYKTQTGQHRKCRTCTAEVAARRRARLAQRRDQA